MVDETWIDYEDEDGEPEWPRPGVDVGAVTRAIMETEPAWLEGTRIDLGSVRWRPTLMRRGAPAILYVHHADALRPYLTHRLKAAVASGFEVHVALELSALWDEDVLLQLGVLEVLVHLIRRDGVVEPQRPVPTLLADEDIVVGREVRRQIARQYCQTLDNGPTAHARGRRFEALVCFLLSQVDDFRVVEHNLRGSTDEIDAIVRCKSVTGWSWSEPGSPYLMIEAKNWKDKVDQAVVSSFIAKVQTRGERVKIGIIFGTSGFTSDAERQLLKLAMSRFRIVLVGPEEIEDWIASDHYAAQFDTIVRRALLV